MPVAWTKQKIASTNKTVGDYNQAHHFSVTIDGQQVDGGINQVDGLGNETEVTENHDGENNQVYYTPARHKHNPVKLTRLFTGDKAFINWRNTVLAGQTQRVTVAITLLAPDGVTPTITYTLYEAWPNKYDGPGLAAHNSATATESIEVRFEKMTMA